MLAVVEARQGVMATWRSSSVERVAGALGGGLKGMVAVKVGLELGVCATKGIKPWVEAGIERSPLDCQMESKSNVEDSEGLECASLPTSLS